MGIWTTEIVLFVSFRQKSYILPSPSGSDTFRKTWISTEYIGQGYAVVSDLLVPLHSPLRPLSSSLSLRARSFRLSLAAS